MSAQRFRDHEPQPLGPHDNQAQHVLWGRAMAVILEKTYLQGKGYWYASEKQRMQGTGQRIFQQYLGPQEQCLARWLGHAPSLGSPEVFKYGAVMALWPVAPNLGLVELIAH